MPTKNDLLVENWNLKNSVGAAVIVTRDDKSKTETTTASNAYLLGGHTPVIHLAAISGCYLLSRVKAKERINHAG